ncbi:hypothetical protein [Litorilituus lipolyticus]|nr:hypothetical protein [Litorilituus lipolyticus]
MKKTIIAFTILASLPVSAKNWSFLVEPYLMATKIEGDASIGRLSGVPVDVDFQTILDNLDMAAMIHAEAHHKSGWGMFIDYGFMDLSQTHTNSRDGIAKATIRQGVLEAAGLYRVNYGRNIVDYFVGIRWWDNDLSLLFDVNITPDNNRMTAVKEDWVDIVAGVRWQHALNKRWSLMARGDLGGFGASADFTSTVETGFSYNISKLMTVNVRYKASWVDYDNGIDEKQIGSFRYDTITHGPTLGLQFKF